MAVRPVASARSAWRRALASGPAGRRHELRVLETRLPVLEQLRLEEALLRADRRHWLLVNRVPPGGTGAVVLGISGKPAELVHEAAARRDGVPLIKRFSGGGTVYVDDGCLMLSLVAGKEALPPGVEHFPRPIMAWTAGMYAAALPERSGFALHDHDYCIGRRKVGGNAQSITRDRFAHHTSFLWRYDAELLERYLKMPARAPEYRAGRPHSEFVAPLSGAADSPEAFVDGVRRSLSFWYDLADAELGDALAALDAKHDKRTKVL